MSDDKIVLTGIKPTGIPHIGNYLGALKSLIDMSQKHKTFIFIADLHCSIAELRFISPLSHNKVASL